MESNASYWLAGAQIGELLGSGTRTIHIEKEAAEETGPCNRRDCALRKAGAKEEAGRRERRASM